MYGPALHTSTEACLCSSVSFLHVSDGHQLKSTNCVFLSSVVFISVKICSSNPPTVCFCSPSQKITRTSRSTRLNLVPENGPGNEGGRRNIDLITYLVPTDVYKYRCQHYILKYAQWSGDNHLPMTPPPYSPLGINHFFYCQYVCLTFSFSLI